MAMEFWGLEVKPGETVKCEPGDIEEDKYLHISQVSLGETKKEKAGENVPIFVHVDGKKLVLGTLSAEKCPQFSVDLVFEKEFELSHGSKSTSVCFLGYKSGLADGSDSEFPDLSDSDAEEAVQIGKKANGTEGKEEGPKPNTVKVNASKPDASASKSKAKIEEAPKKTNKPKADDDDDDDDDSDGDELEEDVSDDDEDMVDSDDESDDEEDDSDDEDEATPKKNESGKKRPAESASKTPVPEKKAKVVTPAGGQKTGGDGKKGGHIATPHPAKQTGKTPGNTNKGKQSPKSAGSVTCKSCNRSFNSENALQAHSKAKHGAN